jgi:hypothetical protein
MHAWIFLPIALTALPSTPTPALTLVWHDSSRLFPPAGTFRLAEEMERLFFDNGLLVRFHAAKESENLLKIPEPRVNAVVLPDEDPRLGLGRSAMAVAHGRRGGKYSIFVSYSAVRRALGHRGSENSPRQIMELGRALSRVVAHEVVHVLAPERGHAESGLMSRNLTRDDLLADAIDLDGPSLERARVALTAWVHRSARPELSVLERPLQAIVPPEVEAPCSFAK